MSAIVETLAGMNDDLRDSLTDSNGEFLKGKEAVEAMNTALDGYMTRLHNLSYRQALQNLKDTSAVEAAMESYQEARVTGLFKESSKAVSTALGTEDELAVISKLGVLAGEYQEMLQGINNLTELETWAVSDDFNIGRELQQWEKDIFATWQAFGLSIEDITTFFNGLDATNQDAFDQM